MLLITRRTGEAIVINGDIEVKVLEVKGGRVKLGFEYPSGSTVFRQELFAKIQEENKAAAQAVPQASTDVLKNVVRNLHSKPHGNTAHAKAPTTATKGLGDESDQPHVQPGRNK